MSQQISAYIKEISEKYKTGRAGEHAYRTPFEKLIKSLDPKLRIINDPKRSEFGAPDFNFFRGELIIGYAETKDIDADLNKIEKSEQLERYFGYSNLILTNYLEFRFFRNGERYCEPIVIGKIIKNTIQTQEDSIGLLEDTLTDFISAKPEAIRSGARLAKIMGGKARRIRDNVIKYLSSKVDKNKELERVYATIKELLVHDLTSETFADMYAQTLVYGLFVARYYDDAPESFSRQKARDLIPASNPFLQHFFDHIAGAEFDKRLAYIISELCEVFKVADVHALMSQYFQKNVWGEDTSGPDPVIHFYEDFLNEYDPVLRKKMGAYYTPLPVVRFIVRAVDEILQKEFGLPDGLADTSKLTNGLHRVQVLDPAVGTGTFISNVIRLIYKRLLDKKQKGRWTTYVHHDLLPRLYGFELMMAPYTIAHLKLSMAFKETGFSIFNRRLGIYLTNSLEQTAPQEMLHLFGFAESITEESKEASKIKQEKPIMVIIGNPPYSISSSNKGEWIQKLIEVYKKGLNETSYNALSDDYVKFLRLAEYFIEKNKSGIVAMITNNSYISGVTHRQMRKHLLETFDDIYILNLHGNAKKKEKAPNSGKDENVFNIMQGVAISIFIRKTSEKKGLGNVHYKDLFGIREYKFEELSKYNIQNIQWKKLAYSEPYYFFVEKDFSKQASYDNFFSITDIYNKYSSGVKTHRDHFVVGFTEDELEQRLQTFTSNLPDDTIKQSLDLQETNDFSLRIVREKIKDINWQESIKHYSYRPFDNRYICYRPELIDRDRIEVMKHFDKENLGLIAPRLCIGEQGFQHGFVSRTLIDVALGGAHSGSETYFFPLYIYSEDGSRKPNFKKEIVDQIEKIIGRVSPEDIFDYIYAVLFSPSYREKYQEFLKIDFPRVTYPKDVKTFRKLVALGSELRSLHLLESDKINEFITTYSVSGTNIVERVINKGNKVFINDKQYFGNVLKNAWEFYIGSYQPAQKWLKDRKGRTLTNEDIEHYQKIIVALVETDKIMKKIDLVL